MTTTFGSMTLEFPLTLPSMSNARFHWAVRARIVKSQRQAVHDWILTAPIIQRANPPLPAVVTLTRIVQRKQWLLDTDNLQGALKAVRDEVATWLKVDDADPKVVWVYEQLADRKTGNALRIKVTKQAKRTRS